MATTNLNLNTLAGTEKLKSFPTPYNDNMTAIDDAFGSGFGVGNNSSVNAELNGLGNGMAIIANGNTHAAITSGQYVYVRQHGSLSEGLYKATANISANGTLSGSNLTAVSSGGLNDVYSSLNSKTSITITAPSGWTFNDNGCYKAGRTVCIIGSFSTTNGTSEKTITFSNAIPSNFRPEIRVDFAGFNNSTDRFLHGIANSNGNIVFYRQETENLTNIAFSFTYIL